MRRILPLLLCVSLGVLLLHPSAATTSPQRPKAFDSVRALMWPVETGQNDDEDNQAFRLQATEVKVHCTVTSINAKYHYYLTAAHCVSDDGTSLVARQYLIGDPLVPANIDEARVVDVDFTNDLAILQTVANAIITPALSLQMHDVEYGQALHMVGHSYGWNQPTYMVGTIANPRQIVPDEPERAFMLFEMPAAPGNSGSAVLNSHDEVVSVLQVAWGLRTFVPVTGGAAWPELMRFSLKYFRA